MSIRILIVDDHKIFVTALAQLLQAEPDFEVIGQAYDGKEAVEAAEREEPDVILMDISMPGMNGIEATRTITTRLPEVEVVALSMHVQEEFVAAMFEAGASGYLVKNCSMEELSRAIHTVMLDKVYVSPAVAGDVMRSYTANRRDAGSSPFIALSAREREVLQLIVEGHETKKVADRLHLSTKTIATHRENIMRKLSIRSIAGLTKYAIRHGLTTTERHMTGE